jgi:hypothetical protein
MDFSFSGSKKQKSRFLERYFVFSKFEPSGNFALIMYVPAKKVTQNATFIHK